MAEILKFKRKSEDTQSKLEEPLVDHDIELITDAVLSLSLDMLIKVGYNLEENFTDILPSIFLIKEAITSLQLKLNGDTHFLQDFAEHTFILKNEV